MAGEARSKNFFDVYANYIFNTIRTFTPGIIISYDKGKMVADVQPSVLLIPDEGNTPVKMGMLQDVPVINHRFEYLEEVGYETGLSHYHQEELKTRIMTPVFKPGDVVMLAICDRNIDNLQKGLFVANSSKKFSMNDAVIIGGWNLTL